MAENSALWGWLSGLPAVWKGKFGHLTERCGSVTEVWIFRPPFMLTDVQFCALGLTVGACAIYNRFLLLPIVQLHSFCICYVYH